MSTIRATGGKGSLMQVNCAECGEMTLCCPFAHYDEGDLGSVHNRPALLSFVACEQCGKGMLVRQEETMSVGGWKTWTVPLRVWPDGGSPPISPAVPAPIRLEHAEAWTCFNARAYTATAVMVRRTLEGICADQGIIKRQPLVASLKDLRNADKIDKRLFDWAEALRALGNAGAHFTGVKVSSDDAADALALSEALLNYLYILNAQYEDFRRRRSAGAS